MKKYLISSLSILALLFTHSIFAQTPSASVQIIHNSADPAADTVDIYLDSVLLVDNLAFREATVFTSVPADTTFLVGIAPASSDSADDIIATFEFTLPADSNFVVVATGVLTPASFNTAVNDSIGFSLAASPAQTEGTDSANVDILVYHGATDAPAVDVLVDTTVFVDSISYGLFDGYLPAPDTIIQLDIAPAGGAPIDSFLADLSNLSGGAAVVLASGFLNPANNQSGADFTLIAVLPDGTVIDLAFPADTLEPAPTANVQIIHNSGDPAAAIVDIYLDSVLLLDDFAYRSATPFTPVPADTAFEVGVAPGNSAGPEEILASFTFTLPADSNFVVIATGVLDPSSFNTTFNDSIGFFLAAESAQTTGTDSSQVDVLVYHGATDAPAVDVLFEGSAIVSNIAYTEFTDGYLGVPDSILELGIAPTGGVAIDTFVADLTDLAGGAAIILASGFLDPATNQNGEPFTLIAVLPDGTVLDLGIITSIAPEKLLTGVSFYPNPVIDRLTVEAEDLTQEPLEISIFNMVGQELLKETIRPSGGNIQKEINLTILNPATYLLRATQGDKITALRILVK